MPVSALPLFVWLSPGFPVGAFAFSQGVEWAVDSGAIRDAASLRIWLEDLVSHGSIRADAVILTAAWRAGQAARIDEALAVNELALALAPTGERLLECGAQGDAFLLAVELAWPAERLSRFIAALAGEATAYPVAVGMAAAAHDIPLRPTLEAFTLAAVANLISAAVRLGPIGQTQAQALIASLFPAVTALAAWAEGTTLEDCGTVAWSADVASMRHETQYSRLFRS